MNKKLAIIIAVFFYLSSAYSSYSYFSSSQEKFRSPVAPYTAPNKGSLGNNEELDNEPKTEECPLNGKLFSKTQKSKWEKRRPLGVMIENHKDARPQSGLTSADVIYEAVAEGGITRFLTIFYCQDASYIGPVRSARVYFIDFLSEYGSNPLYAHVGGANTPGPADALGKIRKIKWNFYNDLNQFAIPFPYYWRDYERLPGRITEHTVYSTTAKLWDYAKVKRKLTDVDAKNNKWDEEFIKWKFKEGKLNANSTLKKISFDFWEGKPEYSIEWEYDKINNAFKRFSGGEPHKDKNNNKQIEAVNLIIIFTQESSADDGYEGKHMLYKTIGKGQALIFQNGEAIEGSWKKKDAFERTIFYNQKSEEIALVGGQVFIEVLPKNNKVAY